MSNKKVNRTLEAHAETQDEIDRRYAALNGEVSRTWFKNDTRAYRFTNESFGDVKNAALNLEGRVLTITASGDPVCLFTGMGALVVDSVDVSVYAKVWAEYKLAAFRSLSWRQFKKRISETDATWKTFPFDLPVSETARNTFTQLRERDDQIAGTDEIFLSEGYAYPLPESTGYLDNQKSYRVMQTKSRDASVRFYRSDFISFLERENVRPGSYSLIYVSNVFDHIINPRTKSKDLTVEAMLPLVQQLVPILEPKKGQLLLNIQWSDQAKPGLVGALKSVNYELIKLGRSYEKGCGSMYLARAKSQ